jgi:hypothetical protein
MTKMRSERDKQLERIAFGPDVLRQFADVLEAK